MHFSFEKQRHLFSSSVKSQSIDSYGMKVSMKWHESVRQGRAYSVTFPPAFGRLQGYRHMQFLLETFLHSK